MHLHILIEETAFIHLHMFTIFLRLWELIHLGLFRLFINCTNFFIDEYRAKEKISNVFVHGETALIVFLAF